MWGDTPQFIIDDLPDEVLAIILKFVADFPIPSFSRSPPPPVVAGRVSRRWRTVALSSPELWTNIRIFGPGDGRRSCHWAAVFARRSQPYPLDISINLEAYTYITDMSGGSDYGYENPLPLSNALAVVSPHMGRWRTFALRGWSNQLEEFCAFVRAQSPLGTVSCLESAHLSAVDSGESYELHDLGDLLAGGRCRSLRVNIRLLLDIDFNRAGMTDTTLSPEFRRLLDSSSVLETLVIRNFGRRNPSTVLGKPRILGASIRSFAISFSVPRWYEVSGNSQSFTCFTDTFSFPNLEYLEIIGGCSGSPAEEIYVPEAWEDPLFPCLRTLRLEGVEFSRKGLALVQSFSRSIVDLQLIHTALYPYLYSQPIINDPWPALRTLTIELSPRNGVVRWIAPFLAARASKGVQTSISELILPLWPPDHALETVEPRLKVYLPRTRPSSGLMHTPSGSGFYLDANNKCLVDFEAVWVPPPEGSLCWNWVREWKMEADLARLEEEIEAALSVRRGMVRRSRRNASERRRNRRVKATPSRFGRHRYDLREDFSVV
ncbi:hypothetical protein B0H16DRAFT_1462594 [Mycena metata]|uniref:F-box domain-containing protein n=1 Tax=Mycena metata TaxID=1033252 RepID=A0AAD7N638_9AGAR|nr:hypothetical protein B0H16DRAFT_1462594 [Mycena metata]